MHTIKDMLWECVLEFGGNWDSYPPLEELFYNKIFHANINRPLFEMLYEGKFWTPICWEEFCQRVMGITDVMIKTT